MKRFAVLLLTLAMAFCCAVPAFAAGTIEVTEDVSVSDDYDWTRFQGQNRRQQQRRKAFHLFHATSSPLSALWSRRYPRLSIALESRMMDRMTTNMMVDRA